MTWGLKIGSKMIPDLLNVHVEELDLEAMEARLFHIKRFSNHPGALSVGIHTRLVRLLADTIRDHPAELHEDVLFWAYHHDDHEAIIGDIPGPLKNLIGEHTHVLNAIEAGLDGTICAAHDKSFPSREIKQIVHKYDKMAETIEWVYILGEKLEPWNWPLDLSLTERTCMNLLEEAGAFPMKA